MPTMQARECPRCRSANSASNRYCWYCGIDLHFPSHPRLPQPPQPPSPRVAVAIELVSGWLFFPGIGWLYAGKTHVGIRLLLAWWSVLLFFFFTALMSGGLSLLCFIPILLPAYFLIPVFSGLFLYQRLRDKQLAAS